MTAVQGNPRPLTKPEAARVRTLAELAREIVAERDMAKLAARTAIEHAIRCGELLIQAKEQCRHGDFEVWAADHCGLSKSAYAGYMRLARRQAELPAADMPIRDALKLLAEPRETRETGEKTKPKSKDLEAAKVQHVAHSVDDEPYHTPFDPDPPLLSRDSSIDLVVEYSSIVRRATDEATNLLPEARWADLLEALQRQVLALKKRVHHRKQVRLGGGITLELPSAADQRAKSPKAEFEDDPAPRDGVQRLLASGKWDPPRLTEHMSKHAKPGKVTLDNVTAWLETGKGGNYHLYGAARAVWSELHDYI